MKKKQYIALGLSAFMLLGASAGVFADDFSWAEDAVAYCQKEKILTGDEKGRLLLGDTITREQMAKMLMETFHKNEISAAEGDAFSDITSDRWSYQYILSFRKYMKKTEDTFQPDKQVTREEFAASLVLASGLTEANIRNRKILNDNFDDAEKVDPDYQKLLCIAVERGYMKGADGLLRPKDVLTRAEVCTLLYRVIQSNEGNLTLDLGVRQSETPLIGTAQVTVEQAQQWAKNKGAADIFVNIAPVYWKYGELTGIRPELLYAQAAKETGYGKYTGAVKPEQNNWAGIKTASATGDTTEDHESFATPDDGVRAHFNHMGAYIGLAPIGEPHARYHVVKKIQWAGTVKKLEDLGGRWCPDLYYGYSVLHDYVEPMMQTVYTDPEQTAPEA